MKKTIFLSLMLFVLSLQWVNAENLKISPEDAENFNNKKEKQTINAANSAVNHSKENSALIEQDMYKRGTGELFETTIKQRQSVRGSSQPIIFQPVNPQPTIPPPIFIQPIRQ